MKLTADMKEREQTLKTKWEDEGDGYASLVGANRAGMMYAMLSGVGDGKLAYVALPKGHPDIGKDYDDLDPEVNGGLTFAAGNVFGWDYMHAFNEGSPETDIPNALEYFRGREVKKKPDR